MGKVRPRGYAATNWVYGTQSQESEVQWMLSEQKRFVSGQKALVGQGRWDLRMSSVYHVFIVAVTWSTFYLFRLHSWWKWYSGQMRCQQHRPQLYLMFKRRFHWIKVIRLVYQSLFPQPHLCIQKHWASKRWSSVKFELCGPGHVNCAYLSDYITAERDNKKFKRSR